ncbi:hypothetical protein PHYC_01213 [Phycisphaerales bacterium]|nr:hypothetical protein PHYC_01213 [Phycisphaerales bacterium]
MTRDTRIQILASVVLVLCLLASGVLAVGMTAVAGRAKLTYTDRIEDGQPIEVSVGIAMGAFRGVFVNFLWIRAEEMKQEGKFYEAIQLAGAITKLQPRFPRVWVFHAWNLAYNLSVGTNTPEERWVWVNAGIRLLRDEGIPANPNDMLIHKELAWIFMHKIGGYTDDANPYYKKQLAREWTIVLGPPPARGPEDRDRDKIIAKYVAWLSQFRDAPDTLEGVIAQEPTVRPLSELVRGMGVVAQDQLLARYEMWQAMKSSGQKAEWTRLFKGIDPQLEAFGAAVDDPGFAKAWPALLAYVRKRVLVRKYHMEPDRMVEYTKTFGPIDWRHYAAHSLYWSQKGVDAGRDRWTEASKRDFDFINADRVVAQSIQELFRSGDLYFDFFSSSIPGQYTMWVGVPNVHFVSSYKGVLDEMRKRSWADQTDQRTSYTPLSAGYENFLKDAVCFFYARGDVKNAEYWRKEMLTYKEINLNDREQREYWAMSLDEFIEHELRDNEITRPAIAIEQVSAGLQQAYAGGLLGGDQELFLRGMDWAKRVHRVFFEAQWRTTAVDVKTARMEQLPEDFQLCAGVQFLGFVQSLGMDDAEKVYDVAPDDLKGFAYDLLVDHFKGELEERAKADPGNQLRSFDRMFPPPDSLGAVRAKMRAYFDSRQKADVNLERK